MFANESTKVDTFSNIQVRPQEKGSGFAGSSLVLLSTERMTNDKD